MNELYFDGTNLKWRFSMMDSARARIAGESANIAVALYGPDNNEDAISETVTEVAAGVYNVSFAFSGLASGLGRYTLVPSHTNPDYVFEPNAGEFILDSYYPTVNDVSPSSTGWVTTLTETETNHWKDAWWLFINGNLSGQVRKITAYNGTTKAVTTTAFSSAPANGDRGMIINK